MWSPGWSRRHSPTSHPCQPPPSRHDFVVARHGSRSRVATASPSRQRAPLVLLVVPSPGAKPDNPPQQSCGTRPAAPPSSPHPDSDPNFDLFPSGPSDLRGASERSTLPRRGSGPKGEGRCRPLFTLWSFGPKRVAVCCSAAAPHLRCAEGRASRLCDALSCACGGNSLPRGAVAGCPASLPAPQRGATPAPLAYGLWHANRGVLNRPWPYDASSPLAVERQNRTGHWSSAAAAR